MIMDLHLLTPHQLREAHEAADYLLKLPIRVDSELRIKLDTFRMDVETELEDRGWPADGPGQPLDARGDAAATAGP
jgi:hypothetical protein